MREAKLSASETRSWVDWTCDVTDKLAMVVSPQWGMQRSIARANWKRLGKRITSNFSGSYHDGARSDRLQADKWMASKISPDSALEVDLESLRSRSHELYRDDSLGGMVDMFVDHIVGTGFTCNAKIRAVDGISKEAAKGFSNSIEAMLERWSMAVDVSRLESWWEITRLLTRHLLVDGEAFLLMSAMAGHDDFDLPIPLVLEVIDPERVETPPEKAGDPLCRMGIQYDKSGLILGYWIRTTHPHDQKQWEIKYRFVSTNRCLHIMEKWFTKQSRGYPWMTRILRHARDGKDLHEAGLVAAQTQACLSVWIQTPTNPLAAAGAASTGTQSNGQRIQNVEPGSVNYVATDEKPLFMSPSGMNQLDSLLKLNEHRIAAGMNAPYEFLARNWDGVSFAGGRLVLSGAKISVGVKQKLVSVRGIAPVYREAVREGMLFDALPFSPTAFNRRPWVYTRHTITPPLWSYAITPREEVKTLLEAVDGNLISHEDAVSQYSGSDFDELIPQRGRELDAQRKANCLPEKREQIESDETSPQDAERMRNA